MNKLAEVIKKYRSGLGLTQIQLATKSGIPSGTIASIESGQSKNPAIDVVAALAIAFNTSIDSLIQQAKGFKLTDDDKRVQSIVDSGRYQPKKTNLKGVSNNLKQVAEVEENRLATEINRLEEMIDAYETQKSALEHLRDSYSELQCDLADKAWDERMAA